MDQGLGTIGLLVLATSLALLLTIGLPISVSKEGVELKDWLGFAGNVLGAFVTLLAAAIAWRAVQFQIRTQRDANLLAILTREEDRLEQELYAIEVCIGYFHIAMAGRLKDNIVSYVSTLSANGFSSENLEMRKVIQDRVGHSAAPSTIILTSEMLSHLYRSANGVRSMVVSVGDSIYNIDDRQQRLDDAATQLRRAETEADRVFQRLVRRSSFIEQRLLPRYRAKIDRGLSEID